MFNIVIDTSVIVDHIRGTSEHLRTLQASKVSHGTQLLVPHIVIVELFVGRETKRKVGREKVERLLQKFELVGLSFSSAKIAGALIRTHKQIPDPFDLLIAAIALEQDAQVATHNKKHFEQIRGLKLYNFPPPLKFDNGKSNALD